MPPSPLQSPQRLPFDLIAVLAFGNFAIGMGAFVVIGLTAPIAGGLGIETAAAGMVLTVYALTYAVASPLAVAATGRLSRRAVLISALVIFLVGSVASALAPSLAWLVAARVLVAVGAALYTPLAAGVAVAVSAPATRGRALSLVFGGITLAQVVGVPLGSWAAYRFGWPAAFWIVAGCATLALVATLWRLPRGIAFQPSTLASIGEVLQSIHVTFAILFTATIMTAVYIVFSFFGPLVEASVGASAEVRSFYLVLFGIGAVAGNLFGGQLTDRIGATRTLALVCLGQMTLMPLLSITPQELLPFAGLVVVWSVFGWSFMAPQQARLVQLAPDSQAVVLALNAACIYVGIAIGSSIGSFVLARQGLAALGICGGIAAGLALLHLVASARLSHGAAVRRPR
jgi:DHA1 family inner membrane transport protein